MAYRRPGQDERRTFFKEKGIQSLKPVSANADYGIAGAMVRYDHGS
jgi:hypothetical protein